MCCNYTKITLYHLLPFLYLLLTSSFVSSLVTSYMTSSVVTSLIITSTMGQKTMSAYDVAMAMKNQELCSSSISGNGCVSTGLMSEEEWKGVEAMKHSVIYWGKDNLCSTECAGNNNGCGPMYLYITQFNVIPGGVESKGEFAEDFSLDLMNALNDDNNACKASFVFFFSRADRFIALRAPSDSYLYPHLNEIYLAVRGYYSEDLDSYAQAANETLVDVYQCLVQEEGMCVTEISDNGGGGFKWKSGYTVIIVVGGCLLFLGLFVCWLCCCVKQDGGGGPSFNLPSFPSFDYDDD